jgi:ribosome-binding factor A
MSRPERLAELLKKEIANILISKINDHRIGFVSLTGVKVSPDLSNARVYVSCLGTDEEKRKSLKGLISAIPFIRGLLADILQLRIVPHLRFVMDDSLEIGSQRVELLNKLAKEREAREKTSGSVQTEN